MPAASVEGPRYSITDYGPDGKLFRPAEDPNAIQEAHNEWAQRAAMGAQWAEGTNPTVMATNELDHFIGKIHEDAASLSKAGDLGLDVDTVARNNGIDLSKPIEQQLAGLSLDEVKAFDTRMQNALDQLFDDPKILAPDDDLNLVTQAEVLHLAATNDPSVVNSPAYQDVVTKLKNRLANPDFRDKFEHGVVVYDGTNSDGTYSPGSEHYLNWFADPKTRAAVIDMVGDLPAVSETPTVHLSPPPETAGVGAGVNPPPNETPTVHLDGNGSTFQASPDAGQPTIRITPDSPTVIIRPESTAPTVRLGSEAAAPTIRLGPDSPTIRLGPEAEAPTIRLGPDSPTVKLGTESTAPTVRLGSEADQPTVRLRADSPTVRLGAETAAPTVRIGANPPETKPPAKSPSSDTIDEPDPTDITD